jgi:hypothetical protein
LRGELDREGQSVRMRAASLTALGMTLADGPARFLAPLGRDANFTVFPDWVRAVLASTL